MALFTKKPLLETWSNLKIFYQTKLPWELDMEVFDIDIFLRRNMIKHIKFCITAFPLSKKTFSKELSLCHKLWFLITISLEPNVGDPRFFKLWILLGQIFWAWIIKGLQHQVSARWVFEYLSLWQKLNSFNWFSFSLLTKSVWKKAIGKNMLLCYLGEMLPQAKFTRQTWTRQKVA